MSSIDPNKVYWDNYTQGIDLYDKDHVLALIVGLHLLKTNDPNNTCFQDTIFAFCTGIERCIGTCNEVVSDETGDLIAKFAVEYDKHL